MEGGGREGSEWGRKGGEGREGGGKEGREVSGGRRNKGRE